jgi:hypothetical protein
MDIQLLSSDMGSDSIVTKYDMKGGRRKLHNEELHNMYSSPSIIRMIKEKEMGRICSTNRGEKERTYWWESQKERDH